jgi:hypothetical protein
VVTWTDREGAANRPRSIGGLGGWFNFKETGQRWRDFIAHLRDPDRPYAEGLRTSILWNYIRHGGDWHQHSLEGTPVFSDETVGLFSYRAWGDLVAAVWSEEENRDYTYIDFYMCERRLCGCSHSWLR